MKKFTSRLFPGIAAAALFAFSSPQSAVADTMLVSYGVTLDDAYAVYPYTGFCTTEDVKDLTIAVKFAESKIGEYAGSQLKSIYIGWSGVHQGYTPEATAFVRTSLNVRMTPSRSFHLRNPLAGTRLFLTNRMKSNPVRIFTSAIQLTCRPMYMDRVLLLMAISRKVHILFHALIIRIRMVIRSGLILALQV